MSGEDKVTGKCPYDDEDTELKLEYTLYQPAVILRLCTCIPRTVTPNHSIMGVIPIIALLPFLTVSSEDTHGPLRFPQPRSG